MRTPGQAKLETVIVKVIVKVHCIIEPLNNLLLLLLSELYILKVTKPTYSRA